MKRLISAALLAIVLAGTGTARAQFQPPSAPNYGPGYRPQLSPYLNLIRGGDPAANYYLGTLPEFQRRANAQLFSTEISELDRRLLGNVPTREQLFGQALPSTGHVTTFGNTLYYFGANTPSRGQRPGATLPGSGLPGQQGRP